LNSKHSLATANSSTRPSCYGRNRLPAAGSMTCSSTPSSTRSRLPKEIAVTVPSTGYRPTHRRGTEWFQWRIERRVEVRLLRLLDEHPATHQSAGDARNQGVEQLAQLGGGRRRCAVDVGFGVSAQHRTTFFFSRAQLPSLRCGPSCGKFGH
jgi:hypothetical protein